MVNKRLSLRAPPLQSARQDARGWCPGFSETWRSLVGLSRPQARLIELQVSAFLAFPTSAQLRLSDNDFSGSPQPTPTSSQRNTFGRACWEVRKMAPAHTIGDAVEAGYRRDD